MVELSLERINANAPYQVNIVGDNGHFQFVTDFDVIYSVQFLEDDIISYESYEFVIVNVNHKKSPVDKKLRETIIAILHEFFVVNNSTILYICETSDEKQSQRARLFRYWFASTSESDYIANFSATILDAEGIKNYASIFLRNDNPNFKEVVTEFSNTVELFSNKPE